jgi:pimeloyl-ACP methyl ester carboxylesterase
MKKLGKLMNGILLFGTMMTPFVAYPRPQEATPQGLAGIWQGVLKVQGLELRIVFKITQTAEGKLTATLDSPDQGAKDIPVNDVAFENGNVKIEVKSIFGAFTGKMESDNATITGEWRQGGAVLPLILKRTEKAPEPPRRPQEPQKPYSYRDEEVVYDNAKAGIKLAGTLTMPNSGGPFPAVILITGSGPQNRDEALLGHKPFLVLADYLTRQGIAVLRYDDRGVGKSTGDFTQATSVDFATDVLAGVEYLKTRKEINAKHIGLIGHSEGGLIAPMVAAQSAEVAFIVLMAGPGITGEQILYLQAALIARAGGADEKAIAKNLELQKKMFAVIKAEKDNAAAEKKLHPMWSQSLAEMSEEERKALDFSGGNPDSLFKAQAKQILSPWFRYFLFHDPQPTLKKVKCPVLAINGEKDLQVPPKENLSAVEKALQAGGNRNFAVKELSGLNHLFQTAETGAPAEYAKIEETISPTALQAMGDWILAQTKK